MGIYGGEVRGELALSDSEQYMDRECPLVSGVGIRKLRYGFLGLVYEDQDVRSEELRIGIVVGFLAMTLHIDE